MKTVTKILIGLGVGAGALAAAHALYKRITSPNLHSNYEECADCEHRFTCRCNAHTEGCEECSGFMTNLHSDCDTECFGHGGSGWGDEDYDDCYDDDEYDDDCDCCDCHDDANYDDECFEDSCGGCCGDCCTCPSDCYEDNYMGEEDSQGNNGGFESLVDYLDNRGDQDSSGSEGGTGKDGADKSGNDSKISTGCVLDCESCHYKNHCISPLYYYTPKTENSDGDTDSSMEHKSLRVLVEDFWRQADEANSIDSFIQEGKLASGESAELTHENLDSLEVPDELRDALIEFSKVQEINAEAIDFFLTIPLSTPDDVLQKYFSDALECKSLDAFSKSQIASKRRMILISLFKRNPHLGRGDMEDVHIGNRVVHKVYLSKVLEDLIADEAAKKCGIKN